MIARRVISVPAFSPSSRSCLGHQPISLASRVYSDFFSTPSVLPSGSFQVVPKFISAEEEASLVEECSRYVDHLDYQYNHWDGVICGYRETEKSRWSEQNATVVERIRHKAFGDEVVIRPRVHVLDLSADGFIKPHVDAVKFCGDTIAGLSLLSDCVMRLTHEKKPEAVVDVLLPRFSLYVMRGDARYVFNHAILQDNESYFQGRHVRRHRRISFICRQPANLPPSPVMPTLNGAMSSPT